MVFTVSLNISVNTKGFVIIVLASFKNQAKVVLSIEDDTEMSDSDYSMYQTNLEHSLFFFNLKYD